MVTNYTIRKPVHKFTYKTNFVLLTTYEIGSFLFIYQFKTYIRSHETIWIVTYESFARICLINKNLSFFFLLLSFRSTLKINFHCFYFFFSKGMSHAFLRTYAQCNYTCNRYFVEWTTTDDDECEFKKFLHWYSFDVFIASEILVQKYLSVSFYFQFRFGKKCVFIFTSIFVFKAKFTWVHNSSEIFQSNSFDFEGAIRNNFRLTKK